MSKADIKHGVQMITAFTAIFIIYITVFTSTYLIVGKVLDGKQVNATTQETQSVSKPEGF